MSATHIQCGVVNHRINRQPLDAESVLYSYSDILERTHAIKNGVTKKGALYAGMFTSVINDNEEAYNGPYYISYGVDDETGYLSYFPNRLSSTYELNEAVDEVEEEVNTVLFGWGTLE